MQRDPLTETYVSLQQRLHLAALQMLGDDMEADDAVADTWLRLRSARECPATEQEATGKLWVTLRRLCIDRLRRRRHFEPVDTLGDTPQPELSMSPAEVERLKRSLLEQLPDMQRRVFEMVGLRDMEYDVCAERLGISVQAARVNMSRARRKLAALYNLQADN